MEATDQGKHARLRHGIPDEYGKKPNTPHYILSRDCN